MKIKSMFAALLVLAASLITLPAADKLFHAKEVQVDLAAGYATDQVSPLNTSIATLTTKGAWTSSVGVNYFLTENFGLGVESNLRDFRGIGVNNVSLSGIARFPVERWRLAPYVFGGAGANFEASDFWTYHAGLGVEVRLTKSAGLFADTRYVWGEASNPDGALTRLGVRFVF